MGFDPLTGTWAAKKAAEIVGGSGGSGGGLPVVELSTSLDLGEQKQLTESECAAMNALNGQPFILKFPTTDGIYSLFMCGFLYFDGYAEYSYLLNNQIISLGGMEGEPWVFAWHNIS